MQKRDQAEVLTLNTIHDNLQVMTLQSQLLRFLAAVPSSTDPIRIMKGLFVVSRAVEEGKLPKIDTFDFKPMNYGPCSPQIYDALDELVEKGLVRAEPVTGENWMKYSVTEAGQKLIAEDIIEAPVAKYIKAVREWCEAQSFTELLRSVYHAYPEFAVNSVLPHLRPNQ